MGFQSLFRVFATHLSSTKVASLMQKLCPTHPPPPPPLLQCALLHFIRQYPLTPLDNLDSTTSSSFCSSVNKVPVDRRNWAPFSSRLSSSGPALDQFNSAVVLPMIGLTSAIWGLVMFQMVSGTSCQCCFRTKQKDSCGDNSMPALHLEEG